MQITKINYSESQSIMTSNKESKKIIVSADCELGDTDKIDALTNLKLFVRSELLKATNEAKAKLKV